MPHSKLIPALVSALALAVAGCGSSSSSQSAAGGQAAAPSTSAAGGASPYGAASTSAAGGASRYGAASTSAAGGAGPYAAASNSSTASAAPVALITTKHDKKLGMILAYGPKTMTVYLFEGDHGAKSSCTGACASAWPPVTGKPQAAGSALHGDLGTVRRSDGTLQVTYKGHPLYRFIKDGDNHDAYGQGVKAFGASWYVLAPSGAKVDKS
jgi:predicted lipoprotein with Yx(FWY)xxD motif